MYYDAHISNITCIMCSQTQQSILESVPEDPEAEAEEEYGEADDQSNTGTGSRVPLQVVKARLVRTPARKNRPDSPEEETFGYEDQLLITELKDGDYDERDDLAVEKYEQDERETEIHDKDQESDDITVERLDHDTVEQDEEEDWDTDLEIEGGLQTYWQRHSLCPLYA
jgi:hypothetical protein